MYAVYIGAMATLLHVSMSLDGYVTGPEDDLRVLHGWAFGDDSMAMHETVSAEFMAAGAVVFGARTLKAGDAWGDEDVFSAPVFVVTHERREPVQRNGSLFTFVDSPAAALASAAAAAGSRDVMVMGSANVAQQLMGLGLIDVFEIALTAVLLGGGIRLFAEEYTARLTLERVLEGRQITHLRYRVS